MTAVVVEKETPHWGTARGSSKNHLFFKGASICQNHRALSAVGREPGYADCTKCRRRLDLLTRMARTQQ